MKYSIFLILLVLISIFPFFISQKQKDIKNIKNYPENEIFNANYYKYDTNLTFSGYFNKIEKFKDKIVFYNGFINKLNNKDWIFVRTDKAIYKDDVIYFKKKFELEYQDLVLNSQTAEYFVKNKYLIVNNFNFNYENISGNGKFAKIYQTSDIIAKNIKFNYKELN